MSSNTGVGHGDRAPPWLPTGLEAETPILETSEGTRRPLEINDKTPPIDTKENETGQQPLQEFLGSGNF